MIQAAIAAIGAGMAIKGLVDGKKSSKAAKAANEAVTQASIRAEALRAQQMRLEAFRQRREVIRQTAIARSLAVSNAANSGAMDSSGFMGGVGQVVALGGQKATAAAENLQIGEGLFSANTDKMRAELALGNARTDQQTASALFSTGVSLMGNARQIGNIAQAQNFQGLFSGT